MFNDQYLDHPAIGDGPIWYAGWYSRCGNQVLARGRGRLLKNCSCARGFDFLVQTISTKWYWSFVRMAFNICCLATGFPSNPHVFTTSVVSLRWRSLQIIWTLQISVWFPNLRPFWTYSCGFPHWKSPQTQAEHQPRLHGEKVSVTKVDLSGLIFVAPMWSKRE